MLLDCLAMLFGELVQRDRERAGLSQEQFAAKLNEVPAQNRPTDPYTKRPKVAMRGWIAKVEAGLLQRDLRVEVREWLARALNGDIAVYRSLPLTAAPQKTERDLLQEQQDFVRDALDRFEVRSQIHIDTPVSGPLSNQRPHLLLLLAGIITKHDSELIIFSNEPAPARQHPPNTLKCVMLLHAVVGELAKDVTSPTAARLCEKFAELEWDEDIESVTCRVFEAARRGRYDELVTLPEAVVAWLESHLTVYALKDPPQATDRYNPLTIVLAESVSNSKRSSYMMDVQGIAKDLPDLSAVEKAFDARRVLFKPFRPTHEEIAAHADLFGIKLQFSR